MSKVADDAHMSRRVGKEIGYILFIKNEDRFMIIADFAVHNFSREPCIKPLCFFGCCARTDKPIERNINIKHASGYDMACDTGGQFLF